MPVPIVVSLEAISCEPDWEPGNYGSYKTFRSLETRKLEIRVNLPQDIDHLQATKDILKALQAVDNVVLDTPTRTLLDA